MAALENKVLTFSRKLVEQKPTLCQKPWGILPTQGCLEIYVGTQSQCLASRLIFALCLAPEMAAQGGLGSWFWFLVLIFWYTRY